MATWYNDDNILVKFGNTEGEVAEGGEINTSDGYKTATFEIDMTDLPNISSSVLYLSDTTIIPAGAIINYVAVEILEATAGTNSNFNLGLRKAADRTAYDDDGLLVAADAWHTSAIGTTTEYRQGDTDHGAVLGIVSTNDSFIVAAYDTGAFTDGRIRVTVKWFTPKAVA